MTNKVEIRELSQRSSKDTKEIVAVFQSLERRNFPSSEALSVETEISKRNTRLLYAQSSSVFVGYLIYIHTPSGLRIHKVCVTESFRRQGIASKLIRRVCEVAQMTGKSVDLWVDEGRIPAMMCYSSCGFEQVGDTVGDYYGPGRNGIRMMWSPE
jgi:ribosomal protein S18 acetylase RimI-like enzyme